MSTSFFMGSTSTLGAHRTITCIRGGCFPPTPSARGDPVHPRRRAVHPPAGFAGAGTEFGEEGQPVVVLATRTASSVDDDPYVETRRRCVEKDEDRKCVRREKYDADCVARPVAVRADLRLVAPTT